MGQLVYIGAKKETVEILNRALETAKIDNTFITEQDNIDWLNDINQNSKSPQRHLKPEDRDLTMEELIRIFPTYTEVGLLSFDVAYSRTSEEEAQKYLGFIRKHKKDILYLRGADELVNRYKTTDADKEVIKLLTQTEPEPELLPVEERYTPDLQSGLFLCKSWSDKPFWVVFGNVERPTFLKEKKYKDNLINNIYRDKKGYAYMLLPLMPINNNQIEFVQDVYNQAYSLGLRENFNFIIPLVYGLDLVNLNDVADDYKVSYTPEELQDRFKRVFSMTSSIYPYRNSMGFIWLDDKKKFNPIGGEGTMQIRTRCSILTALARAIGGKYSAVIMSELTGQRYVEFEFK